MFYNRVINSGVKLFFSFKYMVTLENLFSSINKIRVIKFFIRNPEGFFEKSEIAKMLNIHKDIIAKETKQLWSDGFLKFRKKGRIQTYSLNDKFYLYPEIENLINKAISISDKELISGLKKIGKVHLAVVSGIFIDSNDSRADIMIVGKISPLKLNRFIKFVESQIGKELNFAVLTTEEFKYRYKMFDRFVRDMMELPHKKLISKIKL